MLAYLQALQFGFCTILPKKVFINVKEKKESPKSTAHIN